MERVKFKDEVDESAIAIDLNNIETNNSMFYIVSKRIIDIMGSLAGIILLLPLFLAVAILIKLESKGPIIFKQNRVGKNSKPFYIYKFRSMKEGSPNKSTSEFSDSDYYITKIGRFIRRTSIDELPQLINILKGDMSLVGPRPVIESETELLELREVYKINTLLPGITGLAQINGRDHVDIIEKVKYDYEYLANRSLKLDISILIHTCIKVIKAEGIKEGKKRGENMKILIITPHFWPEEFRINDIAIGLQDKGHKIDVLTNIPNYPFGKYFDDYSLFKNRKQFYGKIGIKRLFVIPRGNSSKIMLILNYLTFMISGILNVPWILSQKYDRILVYQTTPITVAIPAIITKIISKVPIHIYILDLWPETLFTIVNIRNKLMQNISHKICSSIYKAFDKIYISSRGFAKKLTYIDDEKLEYVPQWAEDLYRNSIDVEDKNIKELYKDKTNIVFAGNIGKAQSIETIIKAANLCKENQNIQWIILGDGSEKKYLNDKVNELELSNIKILGRKPVEDMPKYFGKADALLVTLTKDELFKLTVPAKIQSYMAAGKPIIGCISGEGKELIEEADCGFTCEAEEYVELAQIALRIDNMEKYELNRLSLNSLNYFNDNFDRDIVLENMEDIIIGKDKEGAVFNV